MEQDKDHRSLQKPTHHRHNAFDRLLHFSNAGQVNLATAGLMACLPAVKQSATTSL